MIVHLQLDVSRHVLGSLKQRCQKFSRGGQLNRFILRDGVDVEGLVEYAAIKAPFVSVAL